MEQNKYELGIIIRADLDEETQQAEMDRVKGLLDRFGATIEKEDKWGRRKLAYPIAKQAEGVYTFITFTAPPTTPREVESRLRLMENVLRFLTVNMNEAEARKAKAKKDAPGAPAPVVVEAVVEEPVADVVVEAVAEEPAAEVVVETAEEAAAE
jgi:small subunit ribosomal protein S6